MDSGTLLVLIDGQPADSALVNAARDYADAKGFSITLLRVLAEPTRAIRTERGTVVLPWQMMQAMEADALIELEKLRMRYLRGRSHPNTNAVRFGRTIDAVALVAEAEQAEAVLAGSQRHRFMPWLKLHWNLQRELAMPVLFLDGADGLVGDPAQTKLRTVSNLPVFEGMSRKNLISIARNLDEVKIDKGTIVINEGQANHAFWIVVEGELDLTLRGKLLERITPPGVVGVPSMLDGRPAWATVTAATPVRALVASRVQFRVLCADDRVALRLWTEAGTRLRHHITGSLRVAG
jgi:nucleotide-binding universal stress UspA family protein